MRVDAESAFVLHSRPFRETSELVDLFTRHHGRIRVVSRGSRSRKRATRLSPFCPLLVSWSGRTDLKTLIQAEPEGPSNFLQGNQLFVGFYLNELLMRILPEHDPHEFIFDCYAALLGELREGAELEPLLRIFEFSLLEDLGYGLVFDIESDSGEPTDPAVEYLFSPEEGLRRCFDRRSVDHRALFRGAHLLAMAQGDYRQLDVRRSAKRLARQALQPHLGNQPLRSRELFMNSRTEGNE